MEGTVQITKAIFARMKRDGVEDSIKDKFWSNQNRDPSKTRAIWKNRAPAGTPSPYVIYRLVTDTLIEQSTGTGKTQTLAGQLVAGKNQAIQLRQAQVQFSCYAALDARSNESFAIESAGFVDRAITNGKLCFSEGTRFITLFRQTDIEANDDENNFVYTLQYQIDYEMIFDLERLTAG